MNWTLKNLKYYKFLLGALLIFSTQNADCNEIQDANVLLLSFPRSGNTWLRYCIEYITKRPTGEFEYLFPINKIDTFMNNPINNNFDLGVDYAKKPIIKSHFYTKKEMGYGAKYLVLVVRDYKECLLRHLGSFEECVRFLQGPDCYFINNLRTFYSWDVDKKMLIYYEELLQNPEKVYMQIAKFFGEGEENVLSFLNDISSHKANGIVLYERDAAESYSKGEDVRFHAKKLSGAQKTFLDKICEQNNPKLYQLYLSCYRENNRKHYE